MTDREAVARAVRVVMAGHDVCEWECGVITYGLRYSDAGTIVLEAFTGGSKELCGVAMRNMVASLLNLPLSIPAAPARPTYRFEDGFVVDEQGRIVCNFNSSDFKSSEDQERAMLLIDAMATLGREPGQGGTGV